MRAAWIALAVVAGVGCAFDPSGEGTDFDDPVAGPDAGQGESDEESVRVDMEAQDVPPPADVICIDEDLDGFTNTPECGGFMDCHDGDSQTHPTQSAFFSGPNLAGNYDYDCDGAEAKKDTAFYTQNAFECKSGWDSLVPQCGQQSMWMDCDYDWIDFECDCGQLARFQVCR
jgi:hypothetical protein